MADSPRWLRERLEGVTRSTDRGWRVVAAALGVMIVGFAALLVWLWYNLADFR